MKQCPKCNKTYDNSWGQCLSCSTTLVAISDDRGIVQIAPEKKISVKLSRFGFVLGATSGILTTAVLIFAYANAKQSHGASGWLVIYPLMWNMPLSFIVMIVRKMFRAPDLLTAPLMVAVATFQWYWIGCFIGWIYNSFIRLNRKT